MNEMQEILDTLEAERMSENWVRTIDLCKLALQKVSIETHPELWAYLVDVLGTSLMQVTEGDPAKNVEEAIAAFQCALHVRTRDSMPIAWAETLCNLADAYLDRLQGDPGENIEEAILAFESSLLVKTRDAMPAQWAETIHNLAIAYSARIRGDASQNIEKAMELYQLALEIRTREKMPLEWAETANNLAATYHMRIAGSQAENLEHAIDLYQQALEIRTRQMSLYDWSMTMLNLAAAYDQRIRGDPTENLERAIWTHEQALKAIASDMDSAEADIKEEEASARVDLARVYYRRLRGNQAQNMERALSLCQDALQVLTKQETPILWAQALTTMGRVCLSQVWAPPENDKKLESAIQAFEQAMTIYSRDSRPVLWAETMHYLAEAFCFRTSGERRQNIETAIRYFKMALEVRTRQDRPLAWAQTTYKLALAILRRSEEDRARNGELAVDLLHKVLQVYTLEAMPVEYREIQSSLGYLYFADRQWAQAGDSYLAAITATQGLYLVSSTPESRQIELQENRDLSARAAYCLARSDQFTQAVEVLEQGRAQALREALARSRAVLDAVSLSDRAAFVAASEKIAALEAEARGIHKSITHDFQDISTALRIARQELASVASRIQSYVPEFMLRRLDFETISTSVKADRPLAYLITTSQGSLAIIVPALVLALQSKYCVWLDDFRGHDLIQILQRENTSGEVIGGYLIGQMLGGMELLKRELDDSLRILQEQVMIPICARLEALGYSQAVLIPGGRLSLLPLPATVLDSINISLAPSALTWTVASQSVTEQTDSPAVFLGIANPLPNPRPLGFALTEVEAIATSFSTETLRLLPEYKASRANVVENIPGATHIHFACHGSFDLEEPLDSSLFLSSDNRLTLRDLLNGDLDLSKTRLVILSACQTGITDFRRVPDEAIGFPAGFLQAGVPGMVSTLWPVDDVSTAILMIQFYRYLLEDHIEPSMALQRAQVWLRDATAEEMQLASYYEKHARRDPHAYHAMQYFTKHPYVKPFNHPFYWAGFTFTGA